MITPGACDVVTTTLPWAFVELMTTFATALTAAAGTAVATWPLRPGTDKRSTVLELPSVEEGEFETAGIEAVFATCLGKETALGLSSGGEGEIAAGEAEAA